MAWPMVEWVLDSYYADSFHRSASADFSVIVWDGLEGQLLDLMQRIERDFPGVKVFSLPSLGSATVRRHIELGVRGAPEAARAAFAVMEADLQARGLELSSGEPKKKPRPVARSG
jgi:molybdopterin-biosynthesis enzyme MoeA-like protein